jgi:biotin carboxyl carrier protein
LRAHEILVDGKSYKVKLGTCTPGALFSVKVNGKDVEVEINDELDYKSPFTVTVRGRSYKIELKRIDRKSPFPISVNEIPFSVQFKTAKRKIAQITTPSVAVLARKSSRKTVREGEILAPMAGKIVSVKVKKGDAVKLNDVLCTLEAMKMENEITATKSGVIEEVVASEGLAVNEGEVLMKIR